MYSASGICSFKTQCHGIPARYANSKIGWSNKAALEDFCEPSNLLIARRLRLVFGISVSMLIFFWMTLQGGNGMEEFSAQMASSPPFFCGSPPSRVANPLIKDDRFGDDSFAPFSPMSPMSPIPAPSGLSLSPSSSSRKGGCVRASFGHKPAVRVEGFDCLNRDRRNCGIPALA